MITSSTTLHRKILVGEKLVNRELFAKIFLAIIHRYMEKVYGISYCCLFAKFFLANSFNLHGLPEFSPTKYFMCTVYLHVQSQVPIIL